MVPIKTAAVCQPQGKKQIKIISMEGSAMLYNLYLKWIQFQYNKITLSRFTNVLGLGAEASDKLVAGKLRVLVNISK